jgi:hypothetical protein
MEFIQIIEVRTSKFEELSALENESKRRPRADEPCGGRSSPATATTPPATW